MKKVLLVVTKGETGGAQTSIFYLAQGLKACGVDVTVGFGEGEFLKTALSEAGIKFINLKYLRRRINPLANFLFINELRKRIELEKFDTVHFNSSNSLFGAIGAKFCSVKPRTVFTFRGLSVLDPNYKANWFVKQIYRFFFKFCLKFIDVPVFVSKLNFDYALQNGLVENGATIYNGLPESTNFLSRLDARAHLSKITGVNLGDKLIIGSIGRLAYPKNYEFVIGLMPEIIKIQPNVVFVILGDGPEREKYSTLIKKLNLQDKVLLAGDTSKAAQYLQAFDIFVLPSEYEGLSISLLEALQAGLPIIASRVGGTPEMLTYTGKMFESNNTQDFLDKIIPLLTNESERKSLSEQALKKSEQFSITETVNSYLKLY